MWLLLSIALAGPFMDADRVVFTDEANLRAAPDTEAKVVKTLPLGTDVDVLQTGEPLTLWGRTEPWVQVRADGAEGWLWAGLLTDRFEVIGTEGDGVVVGIRGVSDRGSDQALVSVEVGARVGGAVLEPARSDLGVPAEWTVKGVPFGVELVTSGLPDVDPVVRLHFAAGYCAGLAGNMVWVRHGAKMVHLGTFYEGSDAPVFARDGLRFPGEEGGRPGVVLHVVQSGEHADDGTEHYEVNRVTEHKLVDGALVPPIDGSGR